MFVGRKQELKELDRCYQSDRFEFIVLYGRRRIGKTALITTFIQGKPAVYFMGVESNARQNLENFSRSLAETFPELPASTIFPSFQSILEYFFQRAEKERFILAIDEYPYLAKSDKSLPSILQRLIDHYQSSSKMMLILCGSSMSYMNDQVLAYRSPLYGRRTAQMKLNPFSFSEVCLALPWLADEEKALAYGFLGGTPQYLLQLDSRRSFEQNIKSIFLNSSSFLFEEPMNLLKQEVREPALYMAIITAIAGGASRMSEISTKVGESTNVCATYLNHLIALQIIRKETPYGEKMSRRTIYSIEDPMFRFWYRFIPANSSLIARGAADMVYQNISPFFPQYMGKVFEEICIQYLWDRLLKGESPIRFNSLGRWWGNNPIEKKQAEIDIMGVQDSDTALFAECKWTSDPIGLPVLESLLKRARLFPYTKIHLYLFSKVGFTSSCTSRAKELGNVTLRTYQDVLEADSCEHEDADKNSTLARFES